MSSLRRPFLRECDIFVTMAFLAVVLATPQGAFAWGREGHEIIVIVAEHCMRPETAARMRELLARESPEDASVWADEYRHDHRETGPWHYINIPLVDSKIDLARECANGDCVIAKTEQFLAILKDPSTDKDAKAQALKFVIHFMGDLHQPLHDEDNGDKGGNTRHVIFEGHSDNLHWVWDTGLLQHITRNPAAFAAKLESRIRPRDQAEWQKVSIEDWVMQGHRLAQMVAYGDLSNDDPPPINPAYEREADPVIELQLEKAGVRLAYLLDANLMLNAAGQNPESKPQTAVTRGNPDVKVWVNMNSGAYHCPGTRWYMPDPVRGDRLPALLCPGVRHALTNGHALGLSGFVPAQSILGSISITQRRLKQLDTIQLVRELRENGKQGLAYQARPFVLCGIPLPRRKKSSGQRQQAAVSPTHSTGISPAWDGSMPGAIRGAAQVL